MIDKLMKHMKAGGEFLRWLLTQRYYVNLDELGVQSLPIGTDYVDIPTSERELTALLIEFLDSRGIKIWAKPTDSDRWECWISQLKEGKWRENSIQYLGGLDSFTSRQSATEAGMEKAFEILEQQLKEGEK